MKFGPWVPSKTGALQTWPSCGAQDFACSPRPSVIPPPEKGANSHPHPRTDGHPILFFPKAIRDPLQSQKEVVLLAHCPSALTPSVVCKAQGDWCTWPTVLCDHRCPAGLQSGHCLRRPPPPRGGVRGQKRGFVYPKSASNFRPL